VATKAAAAQAETQAVRAENQTILEEAENAKRVTNHLAEACNQANAKFESFRREALGRDNEQNRLRELAERSAKQAEISLQEMTKKNAAMKQAMEQMSEEYHSTVANATNESHTIDEYKRWATIYYHQAEDCTNKLTALEITCQNQQETIAMAEKAFQEKHNEYQLLLRQAEDKHKQLVQHQTKLREEEQKATHHVSAIQDITHQTAIEQRKMLECEKSLESKKTIIKLLEEKIKEQKMELERSNTQLALSARQTTSDDNNDLLQQMRTEVQTILKDAQKQKDNFESDLANKDALIEQAKREFSTLQDQCQRAERENEELTDKIDEMKEIQDKMQSTVDELQTPTKENTVHPFLQEIRDSRGKVFDMTSTTPRKEAKPRIDEAATTCTYHVSSEADSDTDKNSEPEQAIVTVKTTKGNGDPAVDSLLLQKVIKKIQAPKEKLTSTNILRWLKELGGNAGIASPWSDYKEVRWLKEILTATNIWDVFEPGEKRYEKIGQVIYDTLRGLLNTRQKQEVNKLNDECCDKYGRPSGGRMVAWIMVKSVKLDKTGDWKHGWLTIREIQWEGNTHEDVVVFCYKWCQYSDVLGKHMPADMKLELLEDHFKGKPILADSWQHYCRQKDNHAEGLPAPDYNIEFLERTLHRSVKILEEKEAEAKCWADLHPNKRPKKDSRPEPNAAATERPPRKDGNPKGGAGGVHHRRK